MDETSLKMFVMHSPVLRAVSLSCWYRTELLLSLAITVHLKDPTNTEKSWNMLEMQILTASDDGKRSSLNAVTLIKHLK